jgi:hypothetical protein
MFEYKGVCRCFASGRPWAWRCVRTLAFPVASDERQRLLTFSRPDSPFRAAVIASFQGDVVRSVTLARFLRPFSCYGGSLSSKYAFRARFSHFSVSLTSPSGLKYITNVVKLGDSSGGAEIRRVTESGFSLCVKECI